MVAQQVKRPVSLKSFMGYIIYESGREILQQRRQNSTPNDAKVKQHRPIYNYQIPPKNLNRPSLS